MLFQPRCRLPVVSVALILLLFTMAVPTMASPPGQAGSGGRPLRQIARDTWNFYAADPLAQPIRPYLGIETFSIAP